MYTGARRLNRNVAVNIMNAPVLIANVVLLSHCVNESSR